MMNASTLMMTGSGGLTDRQRLIAENERLRGVCARAEETASRYAIMLREGDHRIKNSLQVAASLMHLQARRETSAAVRDALAVAAARIQTIAAIHEALQMSEGADCVDLGAMLKTMCHAMQAMTDTTRRVSIIVSVEPVLAPAALAQPIALAVNELVINALRHAFPDERPGTIRVSITHQDHRLRIVVADDGAGVCADHVDKRGYGMTLVRAMVRQIGGALDVAVDGGTRFTLTAPATLALA